MRFMMIMYPGPNAETEMSPTDGAPEGLLQAMMAFNQRMVDAGVLLSGDGLKPTRNGARVKFGKGKPLVVDGPFTETKEIVGGFWMIQCGSLEEAKAWAVQAPCPPGEMIEIRQIYEPEDFGPEVSAVEREQIKQMSLKAGKAG